MCSLITPVIFDNEFDLARTEGFDGPRDRMIVLASGRLLNWSALLAIAIPTGCFMRKTSVEESPSAVQNGNLAQCKSSSRMFLLHLGVPGDCSQKSTASGQCDKTSYTFLLRCRHALRLQCTERDGVTSPSDSYTERLRLLNTHGVPSSSTVRRSILRFLLQYRHAMRLQFEVTCPAR